MFPRTPRSPRSPFPSLRAAVSATALLACLLVAPSSQAVEPSRGGWYLTGSATKVTASVKDYTLLHEMKALPAVKTKRGVIDADVDKRFSWRLHRDLSCATLKAALRDGFRRNAYTTSATITTFVNACSGTTLKARSTVVIRYVAATKTTTLSVSGMGTTSVVGVDFMRAVWSLWLGNVDQPRLGEALVARL